MRMIRDCLGNGDGDKCQYVLTGLPLLLLAASVSIDALSVGFSLGALGYNIFVAATPLRSRWGRHDGRRVAVWRKDWPIHRRPGRVLGGCVLVALAVHMLLEG